MVLERRDYLVYPQIVHRRLCHALLVYPSFISHKEVPTEEPPAEGLCIVERFDHRLVQALGPGRNYCTYLGGARVLIVG